MASEFQIDTYRITVDDDLDCHGDSFYHFAIIMELEQLCTCIIPEDMETMKKFSYAQIAVCLAGLVAQLMCLVVSSAMITKSSSAVLFSIFLLYNLLRLDAAGLLASFTLVNSRDTVQNVSNVLWLLGTWGVQYTVMELSFEQVLTAFKPNRSQYYTSPVKAVKRSLVTWVAGIIVSSLAVVHAVGAHQKIKDSVVLFTCKDERFYFGYKRWYQLFLMVTVWMVPLWVVTINFIVLVIHFLHKTFCNPDGGWDFFDPRPISRDNYHEQVFVMCLLGGHLVLNVPIRICLLLLLFTEAKPNIFNLQVGELCVIFTSIFSSVTALVWPKFRAEAAKILTYESLKGGDAPIASTSKRSLTAMPLDLSVGKLFGGK